MEGQYTHFAQKTNYYVSATITNNTNQSLLMDSYYNKVKSKKVY